jgi:hypothetical protein
MGIEWVDTGSGAGWPRRTGPVETVNDKLRQIPEADPDLDPEEFDARGSADRPDR